MATSMEKSDAIRPIPNYSNVFGDKATIHDLEHIFDILNETNDDRIISRDFNKIVANVGLKLEPDELKTAYNHIAASVDKKSKAITKESWCKGIHIAHEQPNTHKIYKSVLGGGQYNPQKKRKEISLADIQTALKDTKKSPWLHRIACMESLCRQLTTKSKKMTTEKFHNIFRVHHIPLIKQAKDRRSNVMRVACEVLSKIIMRWGNVYLRYANSTITYIYELVRLKIFVVHITGYSLLSTLFKHCADHKEYKMMHLLGDEAVDSKFQNLQKDCFDLLLVYFQSKKNEKHKKKDEFYQGLMGYVVKGVEDADEIRNSAMTLLAAIESEKPKLTKPTIKKMNVHLKKRYEEEYRTKKKKKRKKTLKEKPITRDTAWDAGDAEEKKEEVVKEKAAETAPKQTDKEKEKPKRKKKDEDTSVKEEEKESDITEEEKEAMYRELLKLNMKTLKKKCKHLRVSSEGSKSVMINRILDKTVTNASK